VLNPLLFQTRPLLFGHAFMNQNNILFIPGFSGTARLESKITNTAVI
jgi:hypothetical protein